MLPVPSLGATVSVSSTDEGCQAGFVTDGDPKNNWQAAKGENVASLEIDLGSSAEIQCISLVEPWHPWSGISQQYDLFYFDGKNWVRIIEGLTTGGTGTTTLFAPVEARKFKLTVRNEKTSPAINELILFRAD